MGILEDSVEILEDSVGILRDSVGILQRSVFSENVFIQKASCYFGIA